MGGNGWADTGPYREDLPAAFREAQEQALDRDDHGFTGRTIDDLWRDPQWREYVFTGGTASVLDFFEFVSGAGQEDRGGRMRLLTDAEVRLWARDGRPTYHDWQEALATTDLFSLDRACGNCTVLYSEGIPSAMGYWGITAD